MCQLDTVRGRSELNYGLELGAKAKNRTTDILTVADFICVRQEAQEVFTVLRYAMYPVCTIHGMDI